MIGAGSKEVLVGVVRWVPWLVLAVVVGVMVLRDPAAHTVTGAYRGGAEAWWSGGDLYGEGIHGFLYLPAFAVLYTPFTWPPRALGDLLWRLAGLLLLATGMHRLARHAIGPGRDAALLLAGVLVIPGAWSAIRNGQANVHLIGLLLHATVDVAAARWGWAAVALGLGLALKPIFVVPVLLFGALARRLRPRLALAVVLVLALPFLATQPAVVAGAYEGFAVKMRIAAAPPTPYTNLFGGLEHLGLDVGQLVRTLVRVLLALGTLLLAWGIWRRHGRRRGATAVLVLTVAYLMLLNPRTEANSYVFAAAPAALMAAGLLGRRPRPGAAALLALGCLLLGTHLDGPALHDATKRWLKPALVLVGTLAVLPWLDRTDAAERPEGAS